MLCECACLLEPRASGFRELVYNKTSDLACLGRGRQQQDPSELGANSS